MNIAKKWIVSGQNGKDIFYFELYTIDGIPSSIYFDSNLVFQVRHKKLLDYIEQLILYNLPDNERENIAHLFFKLIKRIKFYEQFYFRNAVLNKDGKLNMAAYKFVTQMAETKIKGAHNYLVPFSSNSNEESFAVLENHYCLRRDEIMASSKIISKALFEAQLVNDLLQTDYITVYHSNNRFYVHTSENGEKTYLVLNKNKLKFAFEVK